MASLVSPSQKAAWSAKFDDIHDTWKRAVYFFKSPNRVDLFTNNDFNFNYPDSANPAFDFNTVINSGVFDARIMWMTPDKEQNWAEVPSNIPANVCRLKLAPDAFSFLSGVKTINIDGRSCEVKGVTKPHGLFNIQYYTVFCRERENGIG